MSESLYNWVPILTEKRGNININGFIVMGFYMHMYIETFAEEMCLKFRNPSLQQGAG